MENQEGSKADEEIHAIDRNNKDEEEAGEEINRSEGRILRSTCPQC